MATNVLLPQWGMNMEDGLLVGWLVKEGDTVEAGQPLVEVETAKIQSELETPVSGVVAHIMAAAGSTVDVGAIVAVIGEPGEDVPRPSTAKPQRPARRGRAAAGPRSSDGAGRPATAQVTPVARRLARQHGVELDRVQGTGPGARITEEDVRLAIEAQQTGGRTAAQVVPRARQQGVDLTRVQGTGPDGRILVADVERAAAAQPAGPATGVLPLEGMRKIIADRMMESVRSSAQVTLTTEVDMTEAVRLREGLVAQWRPHRLRPLDLDLIVRAVGATLPRHGRLNATLANDEIRLLQDVNVGVAMAVPDGLMVPVIREADRKDLLATAQEVRALGEGSRKGSLAVDDVMGATFTVTSLASYDVDAFTPIIDPPQVAILGVGRIAERAAVHQGELAVRSMMFLSLTFDHRALDGVPAGEFLQDLKGKLEEPAWMVADGQEG